MQNAHNLLTGISHTWGSDWAWGCPLIVLTVIIHVFGLGSIVQRAIPVSGNIFKRHPLAAFAIVMGGTTLLATAMHAIEVGLWAAAYRGIGALPDFKSAMLYSLGAMTAYGHNDLTLETHWRLMGAMEALNGWLLFGLSTAYLFWLIQEVSPRNRDRR